MRGRNPTADEKRFMQKVAEMGCIICSIHLDVYSPAMVHHISGRTKKDCHYSILPLCFEHHQSGVNTDRFVSRHPWKTEFEKRYGSEMELLDKVNELIKG